MEQETADRENDDIALGVRVERYFQFCKTCGCYEYDCFGIDPKCIAIQPGYRNAHQRAKERN